MPINKWTDANRRARPRSTGDFDGGPSFAVFEPAYSSGGKFLSFAK